MVVAAYFPSLRGNFFWDDYSLLAGRLLERPLSEFWRYPPRIALEEHFWPVTYSVFWLLHKVAGYDPFSFRFANILLHGANAVLLWRVLRLLHIRGAWMGAAWFAVHPVHVESVAWIIELKDVLCGFFCLSAAALYFGAEGWQRRRARIIAKAFVPVLYALAIWSKTAAIGLPLVLFLVDWWRGAVRRRDKILLLSVMAIVGVGLLAADLHVARTAAHASVTLAWRDRVELVGRAAWWYAARLLWPAPLCAIYPRWQLGAAWWSSLPTVMLVGAFGVLALAAAHRVWGRPLFAAAAAWLVLLAPTLGFVPHSYMVHSYVADRYQYLPSAVAAAVVAAALATLWDRAATVRALRVAVAGCTAAALTAYAGATLVHASLYGQPEKLLRHTVQHNPQAVDAWVMLGAMLAQRGELREAADCFRKAAALDPAETSARVNLAVVSLQAGDVQTVLEQTSTVLQMAPDHAMSWALRAAVLASTGQREAAHEAAARALRLAPDNDLARRVLADDVTTSAAGR
jgi:Flp pilus assembly protein TadD